MPYGERPIPFQNIIYIGDGLTDVPCMTVTMGQGGYAIAVYKPGNHKGLATCQGLFEAKRVEFIAPADYSTGSKLEKYVKTTLKTVIQGIRFLQVQRDMVSYYMRGSQK